MTPTYVGCTVALCIDLYVRLMLIKLTGHTVFYWGLILCPLYTHASVYLTTTTSLSHETVTRLPIPVKCLEHSQSISYLCQTLVTPPRRLPPEGLLLYATLPQPAHVNKTESNVFRVFALFAPGQRRLEQSWW